MAFMSDMLTLLRTWLTTSGIKIAVIVISLSILFRMSKWIIIGLEKFISEKGEPRLAGEAKKRAQTLGNILRHALFIALLIVGGLMILGEVGIQLGPLIATAGIGAVAIGFGAQSLVKDVISGFFILLEDQYRIGDVIQVAGVSGLVESLTLRRTVLRDLEGAVHTIPNGEIKVVTNLSKEWSRSVLDIAVSYREDIDKVADLLTQIGKELGAEEPYKSAILEPLQVVGVEKFGESEMILRVMVKTVPLKQWDVGRELRRRIKIRFDEKGIEMPYARRVVLWGDKGTDSRTKEPT